MKKFIALAFIAMSFLSFAPAVSAQAFGTYAYCNGVWRLGNCGGPTQQQLAYNQQYSNQYFPVQGMPQGYVQQGSSIYRCSTLSRVGGGLIGGVLGYAIGKNISVSGHHLNGLGAILGAGVGQQVGCELMGTISAPPQFAPSVQAQQRTIVANNTTRIVPAEEQVGGTDSYQARPRTTRHPADCDIGGHPELQDLNVSPEKCEAIRNALRVKKESHCIVGGVSYTQFRDNDPGCLAKWKEVAESGNRYVQVARSEQQAQTSGLWGYKPEAATPQNPMTCFVSAPVNGSKAECSSIKVEPPQANESRGAWEARVKQL
jgi:hypothetical protein